MSNADIKIKIELPNSMTYGQTINYTGFHTDGGCAVDKLKSITSDQWEEILEKPLEEFSSTIDKNIVKMLGDTQ